MAVRRGAVHAANIMKALAGSARPLSAYDLLDRLRTTGVSAPLTIYRALDKLMETGQVHRIASLNAFMACAGPHGHAHPHGSDHAVGFAICNACGAVDEFVDPVLRDRINEDLRARDFRPQTTAVEVRGLCKDCSKD